MSPNNPTRKDSLPVHAARLRELAAGNRRWAIAYKYETDPISQIRLNSLHEDAAALLAGAEALEAVEEVRKALALADSMRLAFDDLVAYAERYAPKSPHEGACTPESGCDAICAELSDLGYAVRLSDMMSKQYAAALARLEGE